MLACSALCRILNEELAQCIVRRDTHADASVQVLLKRLFPETSSDLLTQASASVQDSMEETFTWNRRMRRRFEKSEGLILHLFCGSGRKAFDAVSERSNLVHVPVDRQEDLLADNTFQFLMRQAARGRVKAVVAAPPSKTFSVCRYMQGPAQEVLRPVRVRGESLGSYGIEDMSGQELAQRRIDDVLLMRMMALLVVAGAVNGAERGTPLACVVEHPEDAERGGLEGSEVPSAIRPAQGYASLWATPEWGALAAELKLVEISFHQGPLGHAKIRPTTLYTNLHPDPALIDCWSDGSTMGYQSGARGTSVSWNEWAPGLWLAVANMLGRALRASAGLTGATVRAIDSGFIQHLQQNHTPYRRDCKFCVAGSGRRRAHRRVLTPQAWTLSLDTAGPFHKGDDESGPDNPRYLVVGVLSIPILGNTGGGATEPADRDPDLDVKMFAQHLEDEAWYVDQGCEPDELLPEPSAKELADGGKAWKEWTEQVEKSQAEWLEEAKTQHLPKVQMIDYVLTEAVTSKRQQEIANAVGRMYARIISDGLSVQRVHTDRGREYNNETLRSWCAKFGMHKTLAFAEEHQSNGRAEAAIMQIKGRTRTILQGASAPLSEWPLAAKLAAHELRETARKALKMKPIPSLPYNTEMQVIQVLEQRCLGFTDGESLHQVPILGLLSRLGSANRGRTSLYNEQTVSCSGHK